MSIENSSSFECPCGNCTIIIKSICDFEDLIIKQIPFEWENPIYSDSSIIQTKYKEFRKIESIENEQTYKIYHCTLCNLNICCFIPQNNEKIETYSIINPLLRKTKEIRKKLIFSESYNLWIENNEIDENMSTWPSNDSVEKMLFQKKQEIIDNLFEEKERKVREFVMEQEDLFELKRQEVKKHYSLLTKQCKNKNIINENGTEKTEIKNNSFNEEKDSFDQSYFYSSPKSNSNEIFNFDEEEIEENEIERIKINNQKKEPIPIKMNKNSPVFPATFEDLALSKSNNNYDNDSLL